jgi:hypothetical protein
MNAAMPIVPVLHKGVEYVLSMVQRKSLAAIQGARMGQSRRDYVTPMVPYDPSAAIQIAAVFPRKVDSVVVTLLYLWT